MLELRNVSTHYGKIQALHDVSVEVKEGEIVTLIGANGAGKTTLLMTLCGEPKPSSGSIWFEGEQIDSLTTARIMRKDIAVDVYKRQSSSLPADTVSQPASPAIAGLGLRAATDLFQRQLIEQTLTAHDGNWAATARALDLDGGNLHRLARRLGLKA